MQMAAEMHMNNPEESEDESCAEAKEEEDITISEWNQLGYKWFRREDVCYI